MIDFISQASFEQGFQPAEDLLGHKMLARKLLDKLSLLQTGVVVAIHADWGRGKTDMLSRIFLETSEAEKSTETWLRKPVWINPWQYGTPDLLSPVVIALLERMGPKKRIMSQSIQRAAESVVKAGYNFGLKAVTLTLPGGNVYATAAEEARSLVGALLKTADSPERAVPDPDPVAVMGHRFRELVDELLETEGMSGKGRLLILVDDLDRCAPERQIAFLESIRFLISAGARATFVISLDPALVRQAARITYKSEVFDADQYLQKLFALRLYLPGLSAEDVANLVSYLTSMGTSGVGPENLGPSIQETLDVPMQSFQDGARYAFFTPQLRNPRTISRIVQKIQLICPLAEHPQNCVRGEEGVRRLLMWLCLAELWPQFRVALQRRYHESYKESFENIYYAYRLQHEGWDTTNVPFQGTVKSRVQGRELIETLDLPTLERASHLVTYLDHTQAMYSDSCSLEELDEFLIGLGL